MMEKARIEAMYLYMELIEHDHLEFLTPATQKEELDWARFAKGCHACGRTQSDSELIWGVDEEGLAYAQQRTDNDLRILCRPRRWLCAFDTEAGTARVLCPSCYRLIDINCMEGVWNMDFMDPFHLQMILYK